MGLPRSQRQDELLKIYPIPARVIHRPKTNADGSEIETISNCDFEFPDYNCERWIKKLYEVNSFFMYLLCCTSTLDLFYRTA